MGVYSSLVWKVDQLRGVQEHLRAPICTVKSILRGVRKLMRASTFQCGTMQVTENASKENASKRQCK